MLAAGIKTPAPLDELESHLRQDVEQQMQSGVDAPRAFEIAVARLGRADALKKEFAKARDFWGFLGRDKSAKTNRILGVLWLAGCALSFNTVCRQPFSSHTLGALPDPTLVLMSMNAYFIYAVGMIGSVLLFRGAKWGRSIVRTLALLMVIACVAQILNFRLSAGWRVWCGIVAVFSLVSIWLLHAPEDANLNPSTVAQ
jgi:hypothetical protein